MNRLESMALVVVGCIAILVAGAAGIMLNFASAREEAREGAAMFDGIADPTAGATVKIRQGSIWRGSPAFFIEPFETVVFIFRNGRWVSFTTQNGEVIDCPVSWMVDSIVRSGRAVKDIAFVVHNHFSPVGFTSGDMDARHYLTRKGFAGVFGIYYPARDKFREWEE